MVAFRQSSKFGSYSKNILAVSLLFHNVVFTTLDANML